MAARKKREPENTGIYPWLRLLELEVQPGTHPDRGGSMPRGKGRPPNPFPRKAVHVTLTDDELAVLDELAQVLSKRFGRVHRGHLIAFLAFYLRSRLEMGESLGLPPDVDSLSDLAHYLDQGRIEK